MEKDKILLKSMYLKVRLNKLNILNNLYGHWLIMEMSFNIKLKMDNLLIHQKKSIVYKISNK